MSSDNDNPYLFREVPGSWDVPFKKWLIGTALAIVLVGLGIEDVLQASCTVPVIKWRYSGLAWMKLDGAGAQWFGIFQVGIAVLLNGRYFWRLHPKCWRRYELIQNAGIGLAALSLTITYWFLWKVYI